MRNLWKISTPPKFNSSTLNNGGIFRQAFPIGFPGNFSGAMLAKLRGSGRSTILHHKVKTCGEDGLEISFWPGDFLAIRSLSVKKDEVFVRGGETQTST